MSVLAVDTSSRAAALVLRATPGGHVQAWRGVAGGRLDEELPQALADLLAGPHDPVTSVVVLTGPGSYTGVRAGMAAALGVGMARAIPLHGLGTLIAVGAAATSVSDGVVLAVADAGRGGYFAMEVRRGRGQKVAAAGPVRRRTLEELRDTPGPIASTVALEGVAHQPVDPLAALAAAVPHAIRMPRLDGSALAAVHVTAGEGL